MIKDLVFSNHFVQIEDNIFSQNPIIIILTSNYFMYKQL